MTDSTTSLVILAVVIGLFVWNRLSVGLVAVLTALGLYATGVLDADQALAGFGDPVVVFIAALFVVSEGIDSTGVTGWLGQVLADRVGGGVRALSTAVMLLCALLTALISLNGSVAALLPMVVVVAMRVTVPPARMLMPMAFAGSAGSLLALTGSPVNVLVAAASDDNGAGGFAFFDFAVVGVPILLGTVLIALVAGPRLVPERESTHLPPDLSGYAATIAQHYALHDGLYRLRVRTGSPAVGRPAPDLDLAAYPGTVLVGAQRAGVPLGVTDSPLAVDDVLVLTGPPAEIGRLVVEQGLAVGAQPVTADPATPLLDRELGVIEVVVPPASSLVGRTVFPGLAATDLVILGVRRLGKDRGNVRTELAAGDLLLLHGTWPDIDALIHDRDVLVVDSPDLVRRQAVAPGAPAVRAVVVLVAMIVLLATGAVPPAVAALTAAATMLLLRVVSPDQAYRAISWQTLVLIGGLIPLSTAIQTSGAADQVADVLVAAVGDGSPYLLMLALFALTAILGQIISNTATVLIVLPIAVAAAAETGVSVQPVLMLIAVAGAASLLTPIATPGNMMVMGPGAYRFGDYWKLGLVTMTWWLVVSLTVIPLVWSF